MTALHVPVVSVFHRAKPIHIDDDGHLPGVVHNDNIALMVEPNDQRVLGITVDQNKGITELPLHPSPRYGRYQMLIQVPAPYECNHMRLVRMDGEGRLTVDEVAIVSQGRHFFQTMQRVYDCQCYRDELHGVIIPKFSAPFAASPWPEFVEFVGSHVSTATFRRLPHVRRYRPEQVVLKKLHLTQAEVLWYNLARKMGLVWTGIDVHALVFGCDVPQNGTRLRFLQQGQVIKYKTLNNVADGESGMKKIVGLSY